ncbi:MAG TPA: type 1 glutamine amidotransferase domain-containing protein [Polyangiales bacterium]|nr:type 1 glutamine amidotransferase domain-containing protein [Polyangiales bacterium]
MANVAIIIGPEFEDSEFRIPFDRLMQAEHNVTVLSAKAGESLAGKKGREHIRVEQAVKDHKSAEFDALVIPGGHSPDHLRTEAAVVSFVRSFAQEGKPIAAICHGPQLLIEADLVKGKTLTSWASVRKDLENAGAKWVDKEVVRDGIFITSRKPDDLEAFSNALLSALTESTKKK